MVGKHHVVIVGGGFGGLYAAQSLRYAPVRITLIDKRNFHLFQPLLYQVATGGLSPANIAAPLRSVLRPQSNATVLLAEVTDIDPEQKKVILVDDEIAYDTLIVATGAQNFYYNHPEWAVSAPGLKTIEDATELRRRVLSAFEAAERNADPEEVRKWLTFTIIGGGPTGVELAGALREIALYTMSHDFRNIRAESARVLLVEGSERVLNTYPPELSHKAQRALEKLGVEVRCNLMVTGIDQEGLSVQTPGGDERITTRTVIWAAGVRASDMGKTLAARTGAELDRSGRVHVTPHLTIPQQDAIFVIGDLAHAVDEQNKPLPGVAPVAIQEAQYIARVITSRLQGQNAPEFHYRDKGSMATIGRSNAVAMVGRFRYSGMLAWLTWLFVHLMYIVTFENRLLIMLQWAWSYMTFDRTARLITGTPFCPFRNRTLLKTSENQEKENETRCSTCPEKKHSS